VAKTNTKRPAPAKRAQPPPPPPGRDHRRLYARIAWIGIVVLAAAGAFWVAKKQAEGPNEAVAPPATGLPHTPDYHSLLVDPEDADRLLLGTHVGVYESADGGRTWTFAGLEGDDAMNLVRAGDGRTLWVAGHNVLKKSADWGATWQDVDPDGLPSLDVHGFAVDPRFEDGSVIYAAVAGEGLYRSDDGGKSFEQVSQGVGPAVYGLAVTPHGRVLAAEQRGVFASDDDGTTWKTLLEANVVGLAVQERDDRIILTTGPGIYRSADGGETWDKVQDIGEGSWPVAWAPSDPDRAYVVGFDRKLYRSDDAGATWRVVA
jgi:photosystem II stability/assembly factor-like uncharacterized protein